MENYRVQDRLGLQTAVRHGSLLIFRPWLARLCMKPTIIACMLKQLHHESLAPPIFLGPSLESGSAIANRAQPSELIDNLGTWE